MYVKLFGQEIAFANIDKAVFDQLIQVKHLLYIRIFIFQVSTNPMSDIFWGIFLHPVWITNPCLQQRGFPVPVVWYQ